jgi:polyphosphate kinase 2 (PPK2 family)
MYGAIILEDAAGNDGAIKNYMEFLERYVDMVSARMAETDNLDHKFDMKIRIASANTLMNSIARYL